MCARAYVYGPGFNENGEKVYAWKFVFCLAAGLHIRGIFFFVTSLHVSFLLSRYDNVSVDGTKPDPGAFPTERGQVWISFVSPCIVGFEADAIPVRFRAIVSDSFDINMQLTHSLARSLNRYLNSTQLTRSSSNSIGLGLGLGT